MFRETLDLTVWTLFNSRLHTMTFCQSVKFLLNGDFYEEGKQWKTSSILWVRLTPLNYSNFQSRLKVRFKIWTEFSDSPILYVKKKKKKKKAWGNVRLTLDVQTNRVQIPGDRIYSFLFQFPDPLSRSIILSKDDKYQEHGIRKIKIKITVPERGNGLDLTSPC